MSVIPGTKAARHALIARILDTGHIRSQTELGKELEEYGLSVTQATLSRDLVDLRAERNRNVDGELVYALPADSDTSEIKHPSQRLARLCADLLLSAQASANIVVLATPPGAAQFLAAAIDRTRSETILGTIAGDDTVLVISRDPKGGDALANTFLAMAESPQEEADIFGSTKTGVTP